MQVNPNTSLRDLETLQRKLVLDVEEAHELFNLAETGNELLTSEGALANIQELIQEIRNEQKRHVV
jgi:hypothetical protein